jgi:hypothetical protein
MEVPLDEVKLAGWSSLHFVHQSRRHWDTLLVSHAVDLVLPSFIVSYCPSLPSRAQDPDRRHCRPPRHPPSPEHRWSPVSSAPFLSSCCSSEPPSMLSYPTGAPQLGDVFDEDRITVGAPTSCRRPCHRTLRVLIMAGARTHAALVCAHPMTARPAGRQVKVA